MAEAEHAAEHAREALAYHEFPTRGKLAITATKPLVNQHDLSLAYSPGVAAASSEIARDPSAAERYTARGNLIGVITNGSAVLGLGNIGPLAAKPVMEGKAVLFKKFAGIDAFDIELAEQDPDKLVEIIAALAPTFGGINLEDIKAPECFYIERKLRERLDIPVFHDDQHGTAIIVGAAFTNGAKVVGKALRDMKLVVSGAGAAALAGLSPLRVPFFCRKDPCGASAIRRSASRGGSGAIAGAGKTSGAGAVATAGRAGASGARRVELSSGPRARRI